MSVSGYRLVTLGFCLLIASCGDDPVIRDAPVSDQSLTQPVHTEPQFQRQPRVRARPPLETADASASDRPAPIAPSAHPAQTSAERLVSAETTFRQRDAIFRDTLRKGGVPALERLLAEWDELERNSATKASLSFGRFACAFARNDVEASTQWLVSFIRSSDDLLADGTTPIPVGHARLAALLLEASLDPVAVKSERRMAPDFGLAYWRAIGVLDWKERGFDQLLAFALDLAESGSARADARIAASVLAHAIVYSTRARFPGEASPGDAILSARFLPAAPGSRSSLEYFRSVQRGIEAARTANDESYTLRELSMRREMEAGVPVEDAALTWSLLETVRAAQPFDESAQELAEVAEWLAVPPTSAPRLPK